MIFACLMLSASALFLLRIYLKIADYGLVMVCEPDKVVLYGEIIGMILLFFLGMTAATVAATKMK